MTGADALAHCLTKPGAREDEPWEDTIVAKVVDKIFCFVGDETVGLKCGRDRAEADEWLLRYPTDAEVMAYVGRYGWNTLRLDGAIRDEELLAAIDDSYLDVVSRLPASKRPEGWEDA